MIMIGKFCKCLINEELSIYQCLCCSSICKLYSFFFMQLKAYVILRYELAQINRRAAREDPKSRIHCFSEREDEGVEGIGPICHIIKRRRAPIVIEQHAHTFGIGISQHRLAAVVPGREFHIEPLHAPRLVVAAQAAVGPLAVDGVVGQADADEVVAGHFHLPVVASRGEALGGEDLGAHGEALGAVGVVDVLVRHHGSGEVVRQEDPLVGRPRVQSKNGATFQKLISFFTCCDVQGHVGIIVVVCSLRSAGLLLVFSDRRAASGFVFSKRVQVIH